MANTKILLSIIIVLLIGVAAGSYQVAKNTPGLWQPTTTSQEKSTDTVTNTPSEGSQDGIHTETKSGTTSTSKVSQSGTGDSNVKISANEAKSIVQNNYIQQKGATAGTPKLMTMSGEKVYVVPVIMNGKQVGEIWIDAQTGKDVGGAGGAPTNG